MSARPLIAADLKSLDAVLDARPLVRVCAWCSDAHERQADAERRGYETTSTICPVCRERLLSDTLARRARIAAALISQPLGLLGCQQLHPEDVPAVACRMDAELEAITRSDVEAPAPA